MASNKDVAVAHLNNLFGRLDDQLVRLIEYQQATFDRVALIHKKNLENFLQPYGASVRIVTDGRIPEQISRLNQIRRRLSNVRSVLNNLPSSTVHGTRRGTVRSTRRGAVRGARRDIVPGTRQELIRNIREGIFRRSRRGLVRSTRRGIARSIASSNAGRVCEVHGRIIHSPGQGTSAQTRRGIAHNIATMSVDRVSDNVVNSVVHDKIGNAHSRGVEVLQAQFGQLKC